MTTKQRWKPIKPAVCIGESPQQTRQRREQARHNRAYMHEIWDDLLHDHRGKWLVIYGDQQILIGDEPADVLNGLSEVDRSHCLFLAIAPDDDLR